MWILHCHDARGLVVVLCQDESTFAFACACYIARCVDERVSEAI